MGVIARERMTFGQTLLFWTGLTLFCLLVVAVIYWPGVHDTLIYDDVASALYYRNPAFRWYDNFLPLGNGFIRPGTQVTFALLWLIDEANPFPYHFMAIVLHALVSTTAGAAFYTVLKPSKTGAALVAFATAVAAAAFPPTYMLSSSADVYMTLGALLTLICWSRWLETDRRRWLIGVLLSMLLAVAGKETAVALVGVVGLQTWIARRPRPKAWIASGVVLLVMLGYAALCMSIQKHNDNSYASAGWTSTSPRHILSRITMELGAVFVPVTYDTSPLLPVINAHRCLRLLVKLAAALAVAIAMVQVIRSRTWTINRQAAALYLAGAAFLVPTAILTLNGEPFTPAMRFVYAAIPFSILAVAGVAATAWKSTRILRLGLAALFIAWVIWQVYLIRNHPGTRNYRATSREWKHFVSEIGRLSQQWPPMQAVTVYSGPPHGSRLIPEGYGLALFRVHYPNLLAAYFENRVIPETTRAYIFDGKHLRPTEF